MQHNVGSMPIWWHSDRAQDIRAPQRPSDVFPLPSQLHSLDECCLSQPSVWVEPCYTSGSCHSALRCVSGFHQWYGIPVELILALCFGFRVYLFMLGFLCFCMVLSTDILGGDLGCELLELMALFAEWISGRALAGTWGLQMIPEITMLLLVLCQVCVCMCACATRHLHTRELNLVAPH